MRWKHTRAIKQTDDGMEFVFTGYRIVVDFGGTFPRPAGAWKIVSLFCAGDDYNLVILKHSDTLSFWLLDDDFSFISNNLATIQELFNKLVRPAEVGFHDDCFMCEIQGLISYLAGRHDTALNTLVSVCGAGGLRDAESYWALFDSAVRLGRLPDMLPLIAPVLDKLDVLSPEQMASLKAWLGQFHADRGDFEDGHRLLADAVAGSASLPDWVPDCLAYCSRRDTSSTFADPPELLRQEVEKLGQSALNFLSEGHCAWEPGRYPTITVARHWVQRNVRVVRLGSDDEASLALLRAGGISPAFLQAAAQGRDGVGDACFALSPDVPFASNPTVSLRVKEVAATVLLGGKPILCPFTGDRDLARDTINLHTFLHRKSGRSCIIFSDPDITLAPSDSAWFFPDLGILLTFGWNMRPEAELATTLQRVLDNREAVEAYLASPERTVMVSEEGMGHIGHYVWNVVSGWRRLFDLVGAERIGVLTSYRDKHFFGGVAELYADEIRPIPHVLRIGGPEDAFAAMLEHRSLSLALRDQTVTEDLARRVLAWCQRHVSSEFLHALASIRRATDPLVMITIRCENRAWIEQESGFIHIINRLAAEHPQLGVVIDGLNAPPPGTATFAPMSIEEEQALAERIAAACPTVQIVNAIGCTPAESVLWCSVIDAFAAPIGAGLAKSRWIANKPGVGFSNRTFLEDGHFEGYLYSHFREAPSAMLYVAREDVLDVDEGHHGMAGRTNFSMDWHAPLAKLRTLLSTVKQDTAQMTM